MGMENEQEYEFKIFTRTFFKLNGELEFEA